MKTLHIGLTFLAVALLSMSAKAGTEAYTLPVWTQGQTLNNILIDWNTQAADLSASYYMVKKAENLIALRVKQVNQAGIIAIDPFRVQFDIALSGKLFDGTFYTENFTLDVDYSPAQNTEYRESNVYKLTQSCQLYTISITPNIISQGSQNPLEYLELSTQLHIERYFPFDFDSQRQLCGNELSAVQNVPAKELKVKWTAIQGAEAYDLEWLYIDDYLDKNTYVLQKDLTFNFNENAARVQVSGTNYDIPIVYEHGYLLLRVRGIGRSKDSGGERWIEGKWSHAGNYQTTPVKHPLTGKTAPIRKANGGTPQNVDKYHHSQKFKIATAHENDYKNWQIVTSYAEEGKRKDVVTYMDGTLRGRQVITGLSTEHMTLVGETVYDYQGRPALNVLPVPVNDAALKFYNNFNQNTAGSPYTWTDFDVTKPGCQNPPDPMGISNGAARYYSASNTLLGQTNQPDYLRFIPDAKGYPYVRTEYTPDNTGRIRRQGGVGKEYQPDMEKGPGQGLFEHETRYWYGVPPQEELDALFGNEVGHAIYYRKNMVQDPNGQLSLSYKDAKGNVVATCLAGNPPVNVEPLNSYGTQNMTINLLDFNTKDETEYALDMQYTLLVNTEGWHKFNYEMTAAQYRDAVCQGANTCYDCIYDLELRIADNYACGNILLSFNRTLGHLFAFDSQQMTFSDSADACCATPPVFKMQDSVWLKVGSYSVVKRLKVNEQSAEKYAEHFLNDPDNTCIIPFEDFLNEELANIDISGCSIDCEQAQDELANPPAGLTGKPLQDYLDEIGRAMTEACDTIDNTCEAAYQAMLSDMNPGGQYGVIPVDPNNSIGVSVFATISYLPYAQNKNIFTPWIHPEFPYADENGNTVSFVNSTGVPTPLSGLTLNEFILQWQPSFAKSLLIYHPEHCYYQYCIDHLETSHEFDAKLNEIQTYDEAKKAGYMDVSNMINGNPIIDPFFSSVGASMKVEMVGILNSYMPGITSLQDVAALVVCYKINDPNGAQLCTPPPVFGANPNTKDQEWATFRALYISAKQKIQHELMTEYAILNGKCFNGCIGDASFDPNRDNFNHYPIGGGNFYNGWHNNDDDQYCRWNQAYIFKDKTKRFPSAHDVFDFDDVDVFNDDPAKIVDAAKEKVGNAIPECDTCSREKELALFLNETFSLSQKLFDPNPPSLINVDVSAMSTLTIGIKKFLQIKFPPAMMGVGMHNNVFWVYGASPGCHFFLNPAPGNNWSDISSLCCLNFTGSNTFELTATLKNGLTVQLAGGITPCELNCYKIPLCDLTTPAKELLPFLNQLNALNILGKNSATTISPIVIPGSFAGFFNQGTSPTWKMLCNATTCTGTLSGINTCSFTFYLPAGKTIADISAFLRLEPNSDYLGSDNLTEGFILTAKLTDQSVVTIYGYNSCFKIGGCGYDSIAVTRPKPAPATGVDTLEIINRDAPCFTPTDTTWVDGKEVVWTAADSCRSVFCAPFDTLSRPIPNLCVDHMKAIAQHNAEVRYAVYLDSMKQVFIHRYKRHCLEAAETYTLQYKDARHHFTLYYFDQANNLARTVPPEGVQQLSGTDLAHVDLYRQAKHPVPTYPAHGLYSRYRFNSLNQIIEQKTPDGGQTVFFYDALSRLVASKNAAQQPDNKYSYTLYDYLSRIIEVGEIQEQLGSPALPPFSVTKIDWEFWLAYNDQARTQITQTRYNTPHPDYLNEQHNLRGRVAYSQTLATANGAPKHIAVYDYDIHGNVKTLCQDYRLFPLKKRIEYEYDLISGNVNALYYQRGEKDQFIHRYAYDADNRVTQAQTSPDGYLWDTDARYQYYPHGPLARTLLGEEQVQGLDYAYSIQGWLKGMNSGALDPAYDMGKDGHSVGNGVARDAVGFILGYNALDYQPIGTSVGFEPAYTTGIGFAATPELWNGNIRHMITAIRPFMPTGMPMGYSYTYDQLHRIKSLQAHDKGFAGNTWSGATETDDYQSKFSYDANGNILTLQRNGSTAKGKSLQMDQFVYHYLPNTNQLEYVDDEPTYTGNYDVDIDDQSAGNYTYDALGNLIKDQAEGLDIQWNVYGKIARVDKVDANGKPVVITFDYDATGNRVSKNVNTLAGGWNKNKTTLYARDAQGNILAIYERNFDTKPAGIYLYELFYNVQWESALIYGSSRIGEYRANMCLNGDCLMPPLPSQPYPQGPQWYTRTRAKRQYELSNHLGNVLATVSCRKNPVAGGLGKLDYYEADMLSAQDYYAFGMGMVEREMAVEVGRFGFQGQEKDDEVKGSGNSLNYTFRMHDPRLGRFFAIDPLTADYPYWSPYTFSGNKVINAIELEGLEPYCIINDYNNQGQISSTKIISYRDENGALINQNLTDQNNTNYSDFQGVIINRGINGASLPDGVPQYQGVADIGNVNLLGTTLTGVNYTNLDGDANRRDANSQPGNLAVGGGMTFTYLNDNLSNRSNPYLGASGATNPTRQRFSYTINRQDRVTANFGRNSALFAPGQLAIARQQSRNIADWLNIYTSLSYTLTGNSSSRLPNNAAIGNYTDELGNRVLSAAGVDGAPGTVGGLKLARARAYRNLITGLGIPAGRVRANFGGAIATNVVGQFR